MNPALQHELEQNVIARRFTSETNTTEPNLSESNLSKPNDFMSYGVSTDYRARPSEPRPYTAPGRSSSERYEIDCFSDCHPDEDGIFVNRVCSWHSRREENIDNVTVDSHDGWYFDSATARWLSRAKIDNLIAELRHVNHGVLVAGR